MKLLISLQHDSTAMETLFRRAVAGDEKEMVRVVNAAYRPTAEAIATTKSWTSEAHLVSGPRLRLEGAIEMLAAGAVVLVAERDGVMVGTVQVTPQGDAGFIGMLSVDPTIQTNGLGKQLLQQAENYIGEVLKLLFARMRVIEDRAELLDFYARRGFVPTGERIPFNKPGPGEAIKGDMHFLMLEKKLH